MDRRMFLAMAAVLLPAGHWSSAEASTSEHRIEKIGLQVYSVQELLQHDFERTLARVAAIGYRELEFGEGYYGHSPRETRAMLDRHGLTSPSVHVSYKSLIEKQAQLIEACHIAGHSYLINPWIDVEIRNQPDGWKSVAETFNHIGEASMKAGIQFAYHNHFHEFVPVNGKLPYDILLEECDPELVKMEVDLCWMTVGHQDPLVYFARYPGRFPLVHVKDIKKIPSQAELFSGSLTFDRLDEDMAEVGTGMIDWKRIFAQSRQAGIKHYFVEQDKPTHPFESITASYQYLRHLRF